MSRAFNSIFAIFTALLLALLVGGCESKTEEAVENVAVENAVEADVNLVDNAAENALDEAGNAVENVGNAIDVTHSASPQIVPQPPATDTGPGDESEEGLGAFRQLPDMEVDNWYTVEFFVAPEGEGALKDEGLARESGNADLTDPAFVYVAPAMRVTLKDDPTFEIRPKSDAVVITGPDKSATWLWNVKPLTGGERSLYATVEVLQRNPDGSLKKNADGSYVASMPKTRSASVEVKIGTWRGFMIALQNAASLGDVLTTLFAAWQKTLLTLAALILAGWGVVRAIKGRAPSETQEPGQG